MDIQTLLSAGSSPTEQQISVLWGVGSQPHSVLWSVGSCHAEHRTMDSCPMEHEGPCTALAAGLSFLLPPCAAGPGSGLKAPILASGPT